MEDYTIIPHFQQARQAASNSGEAFPQAIPERRSRDGAVRKPAPTGGKRSDFVIARPSGRGNPFSCRRYGGVIAKGNDRSDVGIAPYGVSKWERFSSTARFCGLIARATALNGGGCLGRALNERPYGTDGRREAAASGGRHPSTGFETGPPPLRAGEVLAAPTAAAGWGPGPYGT